MPSSSIKRILIPLDGSDIAEAVVPYAAGLAKDIKAGIVLFRALAEGEDREAAEAHLEEIAAELRESGMGVATGSDFGQPSTEIVEAARRYEASMIVMTGHATEHGRKDLLGSTAHAVLGKCRTPVLILPLNSTAYAKPAAVVIGHDGSENASVALGPATALSESLSCELLLVRAVEPVAGLGGAAKYYGTVDDFAETDLEDLRQKLASTGLKVTTHVGKRPPEQELLNMADSRLGSVIAVSTSALSTEVNVMGSTTDRLVRSQTHPVLAVPEN